MEKNIDIDVEVSVNEIIEHIENNNLSKDNLLKLKKIIDELLLDPDYKRNYSLTYNHDEYVEIEVEYDDVVEYIEGGVTQREIEKLINLLKEQKVDNTNTIINNWKIELFESVMDKYSYHELEEILKEI